MQPYKLAGGVPAGLIDPSIAELRQVCGPVVRGRLFAGYEGEALSWDRFEQCLSFRGGLGVSCVLKT